MIPANDRADALILRVLRCHGVIPDITGWRVVLAPGGSTDRTYSAVDPSGVEQLTLRLARPGLTDHLRHEELLLAELAREGRGWTPSHVVRIEDPALPDGALLLHEHMAGTPGDLQHVTDEARAALAECLAWVHGHQRQGYTIWPDPQAHSGTRADCYHARLASLRRYRTAHDGLPHAADLLARLGAVTLPAADGWQESGFRLLHGDLTRGNILWRDERVALIDWEYARDGDPAEDIATLVTDQDLPPDVIAALADPYIAAGGDAWVFARLPVWLPLVALDTALWWGDYWLRQGLPAAQADVLNHIDRAIHYTGL